jgi:hypothetical protein
MNVIKLKLTISVLKRMAKWLDNPSRNICPFVTRTATAGHDSYLKWEKKYCIGICKPLFPKIGLEDFRINPFQTRCPCWAYGKSQVVRKCRKILEEVEW